MVKPLRILLVVLALYAGTSTIAGDVKTHTQQRGDAGVEFKRQVETLLDKVPPTAKILTLTFLREFCEKLEAAEAREKKLALLAPYTLVSEENLKAFLEKIPSHDPSRTVIKSLLAAKSLNDADLEKKLQTGTATVEDESEYFSRLDHLGIVELSKVIGIRPGNLLQLARKILSDSSDSYFVAQNTAGYVRVNESGSEKMATELKKISLKRINKLISDLEAQEKTAEFPEQKALIDRLLVAANYQKAILSRSDFSVPHFNSQKEWASRPNLIESGYYNEEIKNLTDNDIAQMFSRCADFLTITSCENNSELGKESLARMQRLFTGDRESFGYDRLAIALEVVQDRLKEGGRDSLLNDPMTSNLIHQARNWAKLLGIKESSLLSAEGTILYTEADQASPDAVIRRQFGINEVAPVRLQLPSSPFPADHEHELAAFPTHLLRALKPSTKTKYDATVPKVQKDHPLAVDNFYALTHSYEYDRKTQKWGSSAKFFARDVILGAIVESSMQHVDSFRAIIEAKDPVKRQELVNNYANWVQEELNSWSGFKSKMPKEMDGVPLIAAIDISRHLDGYVSLVADLLHLFPRVNPQVASDATEVAKAVARVGKSETALALKAAGVYDKAETLAVQLNRTEPSLSARASSTSKEISAIPTEKVETPDAIVAPTTQSQPANRNQYSQPAPRRRLFRRW